MKQNMRGRELSEDQYKELKSAKEANRSADYIDTIKNVPTMQTGLNDDGTIREEKIAPHIYEINGKRDKQ